jgi:hypothetical protein
MKERGLPFTATPSPCVVPRAEAATAAGDTTVAHYPPEVEAFHYAMQRLVAVREVTTGSKGFADLSPETYSLPGEFGDLTHALLPRTQGGLQNEVWFNAEFELSRDEAGWLTLEFLAWWVRDLSRSDEQVQLRPMGLPPKAYEVQLGSTLKFIIDQFVVCPGGDIAAALQMMQDRADSLESSIDLYTEILDEHVRPVG